MKATKINEQHFAQLCQVAGLEYYTTERGDVFVYRANETPENDTKLGFCVFGWESLCNRLQENYLGGSNNGQTRKPA